MAYKIYSYAKNNRAYKSLIAAKYGGVDVEVVANFNFGVDNKTPEFLKKFPVGKVPALDTPDGPLFESNAMARHIARVGKAKLFGNSPYEASLVDQWIDFSVGEIDLPASAWLYPIMGFIPNNPEATQKAKADIRKSLLTLNEYLASRTFLVGERVTLADIVLVCSTLRLYEMVLDPGFRKQFANTNRWFLTCVHQAEFAAVIGEVKLCEKMQVAKEAPAAAPAAAAEKPAPKAAKEAKPKAEKPAAKPKKEEAAAAEDDDDEPKEEKPKTKNPLDLLPPSPFNLDEWKRTYSNSDTKTVAIPWFWEHFDAQGWSLWFAEYKYNHELQKLFMTANLCTGFLQRLERLRKYGFGTVLIFGKEPDPISISAFFLVRGQELPPELTKDCDDYELYTWTQAKLPEDKAKIEEYLIWEGDFNGRGKPADGKTFK
jgi:elongation factor 1-gamma